MNASVYAEKIIQNVERVIVGKKEAIELVLVALFSEGHILLEDVPGVGKTMLARSAATSIGGEFKRIQCTPDLLPNDVTGVSVFNQQRGDFEFRPGPVFVNILLADEINRATPRTQSALLEAMQEQQVTVDGVTRQLPKPFLVMATQNPIEYEGTFPLPEAQLDRFLMKIKLGYPSPADELGLLRKLRGKHPISELKPVVDSAELLQIQTNVWDVYLDESLEEYILRIIEGTRTHPDVLLGASPRASLALMRASQAYALLNGRDHVLPDDIQRLVPSILSHRLLLVPEAELRGRTKVGILRNIVESTPLELGKLD